MILNDTQVNGILNATEDLQIGDMSVSEKLDELNSNLAKLETSTIMISEEVKTRDTLFGKPIYSKTFKFTTTIQGNNIFNYPHDLENIDDIWVDMQNSFIICEAKNNCSYPFIECRYNGDSEELQISVNNTNIIFDASGGWDTNWTKIITIRYTKTTD